MYCLRTQGISLRLVIYIFIVSAGNFLPPDQQNTFFLPYFFLTKKSSRTEVLSQRKDKFQTKIILQKHVFTSKYSFILNTLGEKKSMTFMNLSTISTVCTRISRYIEMPILKLLLFLLFLKISFVYFCGKKKEQ